MQVSEDAVSHPVIELLGDEPTAVYRFYDRGGALLYVGITSNLSNRFEQHASDKFWWRQVVRKTAVLYGSRAEAAAAESRAIITESPIHNIAGIGPAGTQDERLKRLERRIASSQRLVLGETFTFGPEVLEYADIYAKRHGCDSRGAAIVQLILAGIMQFYRYEDADLDAKLIILGEEEAALNALMARRGKSVSAAVP
jgi:predicted GIY-YIG superfamily endonuclease